MFLDRYSRFVGRLALALIWIGAATGGLRADDRPAKEIGDNPAAESQKWDFLDNGSVRIGVDKSRGACIGYFGASGDQRNILNHFDHGRFIQQSYYGDSDGSDWNGKPWRYNPIQGGSWKGVAARVLEFEMNDNDSTLYSKVEPRHWASGDACPEAMMEQWILLDGPIAHVRCKLTYTGKDQNKARSQEMPAVFVDAALKNLVYAEDGELKRRRPGWPNESGTATEEWVAYLDDDDWGLGVLTPGTSKFTCYRFRGNGTAGPRGSACSYVAPLRKIQLRQGEVVEYDFYLTLGSLEEIKQRFAILKREADSTRKRSHTDDKQPNIILLFADDWDTETSVSTGNWEMLKPRISMPWRSKACCLPTRTSPRHSARRLGQDW